MVQKQFCKTAMARYAAALLFVAVALGTSIAVTAPGHAQSSGGPMVQPEDGTQRAPLGPRIKNPQDGESTNEYGPREERNPNARPRGCPYRDRELEMIV